MSYGNCYHDCPDLYDILYRRYLKSAKDFARLVKKNTPHGGRVLDLAAGTGEVSIPLLKAGLRVTSLDASSGMLRALTIKAKKTGVSATTVVADMGRMTYKNTFDAICVRQAINYWVGPKALIQGLARAYKALKPGGTFVFNAPNYQGQRTYPSVSNLYSTPTFTAFVVEENTLTGRLLRHTQHSLVWEHGKPPRFVTDENSFYLFTRREFERAFREAGFARIAIDATHTTLTGIAVK